jgi:acyl-coenzyme A synthetase/AMP-(fatty) acid ligase
MPSDQLASRPYLSIPADFNIAAAIIDRHIAAGRGARVAAWFDDCPYTYAQLGELSNRFANVLSGLGVKRGDRVLLRLGTNLYAMVAILGTLKLGAVVIPSSFLLREHEVEKILHNSEAVVAVSTPELAGAIEAARSRTSLRQLILTADGALNWDRLMEAASPEFMPARTSANELAFIMYTSGTTGEPKGVEHAHRWVPGTGDPVMREMIDLKPDDICYQPQDWSFMYPLGSSFFHPLFAGATVVISESRFDAERVLATIVRRAVTVFAAVPTIYRLLLTVPNAESRYHLNSLRLGISAGEALPPDTFEQWRERFGLTIYDGLGQTEGHIFIANQLNMPIRPGSMGKPLRGYEAAVLDDNGKAQPPGTPGHLAIRNDHPGLTLGYRKDPERWAAVNRNGWYYTQDVAYVDQDGYYWYVARSDDLIKSRAYLISPKEVESALLQHPAILEAAVVGIPDPAVSNKIKAFATLKSGQQPSDSLAAQIREHMRSVIAPYKVPQEIEFLNELPKTANGKILRRALRARHSAETETPSRQS